MAESQTFSTTTKELGRLSSVGATHVAMESTGVYWKPVYNILETNFDVSLINARNRIHKILEDANIKLASVASNVMGVSGLAMLDAIIAGGEDRDTGRFSKREVATQV